MIQSHVGGWHAAQRQAGRGDISYQWSRRQKDVVPSRINLEAICARILPKILARGQSGGDRENAFNIGRVTLPARAVRRCCQIGGVPPQSSPQFARKSCTEA